MMVIFGILGGGILGAWVAKALSVIFQALFFLIVVLYYAQRIYNFLVMTLG
ncbi:hypothetical protein [Aliikangiella maris]|uniref:Sulfite exporter TauE/SafE family protein n=2 Tax=Aliikangiella maris TaxID=3162458 RepID=A0ABV2BYI2_9GAMM